MSDVFVRCPNCGGFPEGEFIITIGEYACRCPVCSCDLCAGRKPHPPLAGGQR